MRDLLPVFELLDLADEIHAVVDRVLGPSGLSRAAWSLVFQLHQRGPLSQSWLAIRCDCAPSNITRLVKRLEARGLVRREVGGDDRRQVIAALTEEGRQLVEELADELAAAEHKLRSRVRERFQG